MTAPTTPSLAKPPSALDLSGPALVPLLALLVDGVPVDDLELAHLLRPVGNALALRRRQLNGFVDRAEPSAFGEHDLHRRAYQILQEFLRLRLAGAAGDRTGGDAEGDAAFLGIDEGGRKAGIGERLGAARAPDGDQCLAALEELRHLAGRRLINQHVRPDLVLEGLEAGLDVLLPAAAELGELDQRMQPICIVERRDDQLLLELRILE